MKVCGRLALPFLRRKSRMLLVLVVGSALTAIACSETLPTTPKPSVYHATASFVNPAGPLILGSFAISFDGLPSETGALAEDQKRQILDETLRQAETALNEDHLEGALDKCRLAIELDPTSAQAYYLMGVAQGRRGASAEAKRALLQAVKLDPSQIATHLYLGKIHLQANDLRAAAGEYQAAIRLGDRSGRGSYGLALVLLVESKYSQALPHLITAVEANPKDPEWLFSLVATELKLRQVDKARMTLLQIEKLPSQDPKFFQRLGKLLLEYRMSKEAEAEFQRAADINVEIGVSLQNTDLSASDLYLEIARLRFNRRDYFGTLQNFDKIDPERLAPNLRAAALNLQGSAFLAVGKLRDAQEKLMQAAQLDTSEPDYLVRLAWTNLLAGDIKGAAAASGIAKSRWPQVPDVRRIVALVERESAPERTRVAFSKDWHLQGEGVVCCPCPTPCPCRSNGRPTLGHCENAGAFRISNGHYGNVPLNGLVFATLSGSMEAQSVITVLFVDRSVSDEQLVALERIYQSFNPLRPFIFLNVRRTEMSFISLQNGTAYEAEIPRVLQIKIQRQLDSQGEPLLQTAALDQFSNTIEYARNLIYKSWDEEGHLKWDFSGRQANFRRIDLDSDTYKNRMMLIQYTDGSGFFNETQLDLIRNLKLPTLPSYPTSSKPKSGSVILPPEADR